jgi:membrane protein
MLQVARAFRAGAPAPSPEKVAEVLRAGAPAAEVLEALGRAGLVKALAGGGLVPARALESITLLDVRRALAGAQLPESRRGTTAAAVVLQADGLADERLRLANFRDLCDERPPDGPVARGGEPPLSRV